MNLKNKTTSVFNYNNYLRDYYNRLASGEEKVPSDAELSLFLRKLVKLGSLKSEPLELTEQDESIDDVVFKMTA